MLNMISIVLLFILLPQLIRAQCKDLKLDWATYTGEYNSNTGICTFSNVRFAQPPTGEYRFQAPRTPPSSSDPPAPEQPVSCIQVDVTKPCTPGNDLFLINPNCTNKPIDVKREDCLFLDIYVPETVLNGNSKVPVVVWFYGGAYVFGSKHQFDIGKIPLYSGQGLLQSTQEPLVYVVGNYRLGAFGWLAGSYMEAQALPNAGLYDQRAVLEFVQNYIDNVNGDKTNVSAWGESAGASSILHHLIAKDGGQDPLFSKAVLQSPAYEWQWDRAGTLNETYTTFAGLAGCPNADLQCLQSADVKNLTSANQQIFQTDTACMGIFPMGPSLDNTLIRRLAPVAFVTGKYWTGLNSIIISHVSDEVPLNSRFIPYPIRRDRTVASFENFLSVLMSGNELAHVRDQINTTYPSNDFNNDQVARAARVIRDASFTCNTRQLFDAYHDKIPTWMMNYHFLDNYDAAVHASDLLPTYCNKDVNVTNLLICNKVPPLAARVIGPYMKNTFSPAYLSYLKSHAIHGDPNTGATGVALEVNWPTATASADKKYVENVMQPYYPSIPQPPFKNATQDPNNTAMSCDFWNSIASQIMDIFGEHQHDPSLKIQDPANLPQVELRH